ncbi:unnamed protein product [Protopolystoma xenopodis]|uniref:Uncharacterized protein n=1 Tax=Protopolystoma xenopodis TaxID=117903 RepID=A0A3S5AT91_9PLAT|nr:unnamed protein product [Protopolystoma xenopodis]
MQSPGTTPLKMFSFSHLGYSSSLISSLRQHCQRESNRCLSSHLFFLSLLSQQAFLSPIDTTGLQIRDAKRDSNPGSAIFTFDMLCSATSANGSRDRGDFEDIYFREQSSCQLHSKVPKRRGFALPFLQATT